MFWLLPLIILTAQVTAYNPVEAQCDSTPYITASGYNLCEALDRGELICAYNQVSLGTIIYIEDLGFCRVEDRTSRKYQNRIDIAMKGYDDAVRWGIRNKKVYILN